MKHSPNRIFLIGIMGAGKSFWAEKLGTHYGIPMFDTDAMVEAEARQTIPGIFAGAGGQDRFREMERQILQNTPWPNACIISCGGGLPCFFNNIDYMLQSGMVVWINPAVETLVQRLWREKDHRPLVAMAKDMEELDLRIRDLRKNREPFYRKANLVLDQDCNETFFIQQLDSLSGFGHFP